MKFVLDTNVLISGIFFAGPPKAVIEAWIDGRIDVICDVESLDEQICDDPDDDKFLACALASGAKGLVTGDKALLRVERLRGLRILRPRSFVEEYLSQ